MTLNPLDYFRRSSRGRIRFGLEVRPDGLSWALLRGDGEVRRSGYVACSPEQRAERLTELVRFLGIRRARTTLVLPTRQYRVFQIERPTVADDEMADAVRWKLKDLLDYPLNEAVIDTFPVPDVTASAPGKTVHAVATRRQVVEELVQLVRQAGLRMERIDIAELALRNLAVALNPSDRPKALVYLRETLGLMIFVQKGYLCMARRLDIAAEQLEDAARQSDAVESLGLEMQRSLDYYESQLRMVPPPMVSVMAHSHGLPLASMLDGNVSANIQNVDWSRLMEPPPEDLRVCLALGAVLPQPAGGS